MLSSQCGPDLLDCTRSGVLPGEGRLLACLKKKVKNLQPGCKAQVLIYYMYEYTSISLPIHERICVFAIYICVLYDKGRLLACLKQKSKSLQPACEAQVLIRDLYIYIDISISNYLSIPVHIYVFAIYIYVI